jgi:hypothetical protein
MILQLADLPTIAVRGVYTIDGIPGRMPARALYLHPDAARSFLDDLAEAVTVSDVFRSAESSLAAVRAGRGAKPPGYSGHNYGLSIDLDIPATSKAVGATTKKNLDLWMAQRGWVCHRSDYAPASWKPIANEAWHYNFLPGHTWGKSSPAALEARIVELYGAQFVLDEKAQQVALATLHLYHGAIDGELGPLSKEAIRAFQRTWGLPETGKADARTQRTLAFVASERQVVP